MTYAAIEFTYDKSGKALPDALGSVDGGVTEEPHGTGPISDVLYSAAGNSGPDGGAAGNSGGRARLPQITRRRRDVGRCGIIAGHPGRVRGTRLPG